MAYFRTSAGAATLKWQRQAMVKAEIPLPSSSLLPPDSPIPMQMRPKAATKIVTATLSKIVTATLFPRGSIHRRAAVVPRKSVAVTILEAGMRAALLLVVPLAGCAAHEMTATEATEAANTEINRTLPQMDRSRRTVRADDADGKWRVTYASPDDVNAGGPLIVEVDKRTRQATIIQMAQ